MNVLATADDPRRAVAPLFAAVLLAAWVGAGFTLTTAVATGGSAAPESGPEPGKAPEAAGYGRLPLYFVHNEGQAPEEIDFAVSGGETTIGFSDSGVTYARGDTAMTQTFVGGSAKPAGAVEGATFSWFKGDRKDWVTAPSYETVRYEGVWPGIDAVYSGSSSRLKYRFVVSPGADPTDIRIGYDAPLTLDGNGDLRVGGERGFTELAPVAYQGRGDARTEVGSAYRLAPNGYRFALGGYDPTRPLVIDPAAVIYAGFIGGSADDRGQGIAVDPSGNAYLTGEANSTEATFPATGGPDTSLNGDADAFVAKVNASGTALVYAGYIGGSSGEVGRGIAVDASGNAYVTGETYSSAATFPETGGPDLSENGSQDAFVAKVNASGTGLVYAGYIGGSDAEYGVGIALDPTGRAYVAGTTGSSEANFPVTGGPDLVMDGLTDAFIAKVNASGTGLVYAGYIGGSGTEMGGGVAVDPSGNAYVAGETLSDQTTFPVTGGPDLTHNGITDAFVAKVNASGTGLVYAGYIGGSLSDYGGGIAVDASGSAYVTGHTTSPQTTFPETGGPDLTHNGLTDAFIAKVNASGTGLVYAGYLGGSGDDNGVGIALDASGGAYVAGDTVSTQATFQVTGGPDLTQNGSKDAFVAKVVAERPDGHVKLGGGGYIGNGIYNTTAAGQTKTAKVAKGKSATFTFKVENDGSTDGINVAGSASNSKFKATYLEGTTDITTDVVGGSYAVNGLANGAFDELTLKVKLSKRAKGSASFLIMLTSQGDGSMKDAVKAVVKVKK